jgi:plasmid stability protein
LTVTLEAEAFEVVAEAFEPTEYPLEVVAAACLVVELELLEPQAASTIAAVAATRRPAS